MYNINVQIVTSLSLPHKTKSGPGSNYINMYIYLTANYKTWICTGTLQSPTEHGKHNHPHKVTLSASKTKHRYIHINNPQCVPQCVPLKTSFTAPFRATAAVSDTKSMGIFQPVSLCTVPGSQSFSYKAQGSAGLHR